MASEGFLYQLLDKHPAKYVCARVCVMVARLQRDLAGRQGKEREKETLLAELSCQLHALKEEKEELHSSLTSARSALIK